MRWIDATWILGLGGASRLSQSGLSFAVTPENTAVLATGADPLTITVTDPLDYAGSSVFSPADLSAGPVVVISPGIVGTPSVGQTVTARPALWVYEGTGSEPVRSWQWRADGVDIPGATLETFTPTAGEAGTDLSVVETANDSFGQRSVASTEIPVGT